MSASTKCRRTELDLRGTSLIVARQHNCRFHIFGPFGVTLKICRNRPTTFVGRLNGDRQRRGVSHGYVLADRTVVGVALGWGRVTF